MKRLLVTSVILLMTHFTSVKAADQLTRKIGQKFFDIAKELRLHSTTEVIVTIYVNPEGGIRILKTNCNDSSINKVVTRRMESIVLRENYKTGVHRFRLVFKPE